ncbi:MAG: CotH kinase family protein [Bacteroidales bacterium]
MKKSTLFVLIVMLFSAKLSAQSSFYDVNSIQLIEITFAQSNWDYMMDTAKAGSEGYIMASMVKINGVEYDSVGVKYKGNSTYRANQVKNPLHIELDTYKNQDHQGFTDIKLSNVFNDPSFLREVLSYKIVRNYMPAPQSNYANVYINNSLIGLYTNSESIGKKFVDGHFGSKSNSFFKCNPINGAGPGSSAFPNLVYLGTDSSQYYSRYELQSDYGWYDLINLCDTLANHTTAIENTMNVNQALWMLAFDNLLVNLDSYLGGFSQNYYLYKDASSLFQPVVWDMNESFGRFSMTGTINLPSTTTKQQMTHLLHLTDSNWPLVKNLLSNATYKRMYIAHIKTILAENFANNLYYTDGLALQTLIGPSVSADPNKFYTYTNFINNLTTDVSGGNGSAPGLTNLMNGRNTYLSALADFTATQPVINSIQVSNNQPAIGTLVFITANVTNASSSGVYIAYRNAGFSPFLRVQMFDDGLHGDGAASDGVFGASIPISAGKTEYYLYAENSQAGIFSPQRADVEFYTLTAQASANGNLVINEFLASNVTIIADQDGEFDDWVEIRNLTDQVIALDSVYLSDSYTNLLKWKFPDGTAIQPYSYLTVWTDDDGLQAGLHASFKLSASGERVALTHATSGVLDSISFGVQTNDISMQRCPDASGDFIFATPSFSDTNNCTTSITEEISDPKLSVFPNPCVKYVHIQSPDLVINTVRVINMVGQVVLQKQGINTNKLDFDFSHLPCGLYILVLNDVVSHKVVKE